jgi:hypothetical protein
MTDTFKGIVTADGKKRQLPYGSILDIPKSDPSLTVEGGFADAAVVGKKNKKMDDAIASLKEDLKNSTMTPVTDYIIDTKDVRIGAVLGHGVASVSICKNNGLSIGIQGYADANKEERKYDSGWIVNETSLSNLDTSLWYYVVIRKADNSLITIDDVKANLSMYFYWSLPKQIDELKNNIYEELNDVSDKIFAQKNTIEDLKSTVLSEISNKTITTVSLTQIKSINADEPFIDDFVIKNGSVCKLMIIGLNGAEIDTFAANFYYLLSDGSVKKISSIRFGKEYEFVSDTDAIGIRMYVDTHKVIKDGDFEITVESINKNPKSLQSQIDGIIDKTVEVDDIIAATTIIRNSEIKIGANSNNDSGNTTYIFKKIEIPVTKDDCIGVKIASITGAIRDNPVYIYCNDSSGKNIKSFSYNEEDVKNGVIITPPTSCAKVDIRLYPSITGGLTDTFAIYSDVKIWKSSDGRYTIKKEYIPKNNPPAYYLKDNYMDNKISEIRKLIKKADGNYDAFFFCTDQHWTLNAKKSPLLMRYISERVNIPRAFMGGDYADGINRDAIMAFSSNYEGKIYNITGNHEFMDYWCENGAMVSQDITGADIWANLDGHMTDCIIGNAHRNYYYVDNIVQKIRYIILSVFDDGSSSNFDADQHTWLENTALSMPGNYSAIIFAHHIINVDSDYRVSVTEFGADIISIAERNGNVIAMFSGHTHIDVVYKTSGGIPCFVTTCDKFQPWIDNGQNKEPLLSKRVEGTTTEQAFDVVIADKKNKIISAVRIGCPADNDGKELLEVRQQSYGLVESRN